MLSDYLRLLSLDDNQLTQVLALIAAFYSVASTILGAMTLAIGWCKLDEVRSLVRRKKPAEPDDVLPVEESAVVEPMEPVPAGADV
jgi:hypothetical protein